VSKELSPKWLYDERGCQLFDEITRLAEYYPTRTERSILERCADEIAALTKAETLLELGSGTSEKTRLLLDALDDHDTLRHFVAFDVAQRTMVEAAEKLTIDYPHMSITAVVGDFERHVGQLPRFGRQLIAFLGGTIGNLQPTTRAALLGELAQIMAPGDALLIGTDLVKDRGRLVAAYDDAAGVTAAFNRNVLAVLNRELGADFVLDRFAHVALFDEENSWIEMRLRSLIDQRVCLRDLGLGIDFTVGEDEIRVDKMHFLGYPVSLFGDGAISLTGDWMEIVFVPRLGKSDWNSILPIIGAPFDLLSNIFKGALTPVVLSGSFDKPDLSVRPFHFLKPSVRKLIEEKSPQ